MSSPAGDRIERALAEFVDGRAAALRDVGPELEPVAEEARQFVLAGGKRLRPTFVYWGWRSVRPATDDDTAVLTAAASLELLHACALVHDDLMDASATRRGRPTVHVGFADLHRAAGWPGDARVFGAAAAILMGDLLLSWADAMFASAGLERDAQLVFENTRELVMAGQYLDVLVQARGRFSAEEALRVVAYKTSKYTVEGPLLLGATAAGAEAEVREALTRYGSTVGEVFQLRDDVLGVFGDPDETGKPAGDDLREGKHTLLVAYAMEQANPTQAALLRERLGDRDMDDTTVAALRSVIADSGALERVEHQITERTAQARAALRGGHIAPDAATALDGLAIAASHRRR